MTQLQQLKLQNIEWSGYIDDSAAAEREENKSNPTLSVAISEKCLKVTLLANA